MSPAAGLLGPVADGAAEPPAVTVALRGSARGAADLACVDLPHRVNRLGRLQRRAAGTRPMAPESDGAAVLPGRDPDPADRVGAVASLLRRPVQRSDARVPRAVCPQAPRE